MSALTCTVQARTWLASSNGLALDVLDPSPVDVDFAEVAHGLAHLNRYAGNARIPVSVGLHTLIGLDLCESAALRAQWLLHDAHEHRIGEVPNPVKAARLTLAAELYGADTAERLAFVEATLQGRHDRAIHAAAGLAVPGPNELAALRLVDLRALATERRDFCRVGPFRLPWPGLDDAPEPIAPSTRVWRWAPPIEVAERLMLAFRTFLPALAAQRRAS